MHLCLSCMEQYDEKYGICPNCGADYNIKASESFHLEPGTELGERYIVGRVLGQGGFGVTYIGFDIELKKKVAIKEYLPSEFSTRSVHETKVTVFGGDKEEQFKAGIARFVKEAKRLAKFNKESEIINIYDTVEENGTAYIIME